MFFRSKVLEDRLKQSSDLAFTLFAGLTAFAAYGCVYAIRKPFTAAGFSGFYFFGVDYKIALVIAQVLGYATSKFLGITQISALSPETRMRKLLLMAGISLAGLLGLAVCPPQLGVFWMFINGLPLGMAWGIVFSYLEGRRVTEALAALLCVNFILSSGFVKTVGRWMIESEGVTEFWMPFATGTLFFPLLLVCIWLLEHLPKPSEADKAARNTRQPMQRDERLALWRRFMPGIVALVLVYLFLNVIRDVRDNFALEIWKELGFGNQPAIFTLAELPIALVVLLIVGLLALIKNNFTAFKIYHYIIIGSGLVLIGSTLLFQYGLLPALFWMIISGTAIILPYIIFNGIIFDRMMGSFKITGNVGFLMYLADSFGYLGSVGVLLWRNFGQNSMTWKAFFLQMCVYGGVGVALVGAYSIFYFSRKYVP
jgi:hypothetical protein